MTTSRALALAATLFAALILPLGAAEAGAHDDLVALAQDGEPAICQYVGYPLYQWVCVGVDIGDIGSHA